jgi:hypothetical protein
MRDRDRRTHSPRRNLARIASVGLLGIAMGFGAPGVVLAQGTASVVAPLSTPSCDDGNVCTWSGGSYSGFKDTFGCQSQFRSTSFDANSVKNRCGNRRVYLGWSDGDFINWKACINPGGELPWVGRFNRVSIDQAGSRC